MIARPSQSGFSLVELSIVLVILGLLTGGILAGQSLIHAAELRSVSTEYTAWKTAVSSYQDKYFALPGDMTNATRFWGDDNGICPDAAVTNGNPGTCNGNGNGQIDVTGGANANSEHQRLWQHLALAGLVTGSYSGTNDATGGSTRSVNTPASKLGQTCWSEFNFPTIPIDGVSSGWANFEGNYGNTLILGNVIASRMCEVNAFKAEDAWNIDSKMDDGRPGLGFVRTYEGYTNCQDAGISAALPLAGVANYKLSDTSNGCILLFNL